MLLIISIVKNGLDQTIYIPEMCMKDFSRKPTIFNDYFQEKKKKSWLHVFFSKNPKSRKKNKYKEIFGFFINSDSGCAETHLYDDVYSCYMCWLTGEN